MTKSDKIAFRAIEVFGSPEEAETWMTHPVDALERQRPVDLIVTPEGRQRVNDCLDSMEFRVYS